MAEFSVNFQAVGELNDDGTIKRDIRICALTGLDTEPGDVMYSVAGTNKFYRVKAGILRIPGATEARQQLEASLKPAPSPAPVARKLADIPAPTTPKEN